MPARDTRDIRVVFRGVGSHNLPLPRQVAWHFYAPWISDKVTSHDIAFGRWTAIWCNKWYETAWDNTRIPAFYDCSEADNNASFVTDAFCQPGLNLPDDVK